MNFISFLNMGCWGGLMLILDRFRRSCNLIFYFCFGMYYILCWDGTSFYTSYGNDQSDIHLKIQNKISISISFYQEILLPYFMSLEFNYSYLMHHILMEK